MSGVSPRPERLRAEMARREIGALLLTHIVNVGYVTGFTGTTATVLVTPTNAIFVADSRYWLQAEQQCPGFSVRKCGPSVRVMETAAEVARELGMESLHFEADHVAVAQLEKWTESFAPVQLKPAKEVVETLRLVKDAGEITCIREAVALVDRAFDYILGLARPGAREQEIAIELEYFLRKQGSEREAFEIIVASGARSAMPHGRASDKLIEAGDFVTFDYGACRGGYFSDMTRTVVLGKATDRQREIYGIVLEAQEAALRAIGPGVEAKRVDAAARDLITARGHGDHFGHGTGHGLGRDVHDSLGFSARSETTLAAGMVLTVEPGIYIDGWGGVRIEDDIVVTEDGCEVLTRSPKHLIEL